MNQKSKIAIPFHHLKRLSTPLGLYEHAKLDVPRTEHGYCVDDVSRGLILLCNESELDVDSRKLLDQYLDFTLSAITTNGSCHNRMNADGVWANDSSTADWWGRAIWALGVCAVRGPEVDHRIRSLEGFRVLTNSSSSDLMPLVFAALGAGEVLMAYPAEIGARKILVDARSKLLPSKLNAEWLWPEPRLRYSNGSIVQAVLLTSVALNDQETISTGIRMLEFLIRSETLEEHFSVTPVGGRGPGDKKPAFDQQPIEVAAIASACAQAWRVTGEDKWLNEVNRAWLWFLGVNDFGTKMFIPETGAGYDGLQEDGPNFNQGAESTIAMLSTAQLVEQLGMAL